MKEKLKKYWKPILGVTVGFLIALYFYKKSQASAASNSAAQIAAQENAAAQQQAQNAQIQSALAASQGSGASSAINSTVPVSTSPTVQPGTSASGVPSIASTGYVSPAPLPTASYNVPQSAPVSGLNSLAAAVAGTSGVPSDNAQPGTAIYSPAASQAPVSGYFSSAAYLAGNAAAERSSCAYDPNGPGCAVVQATDPNYTGAFTNADALLTAQNICEQGGENSAIFGQNDLGITSGQCNGNQPSAQLIQQAMNAHGINTTVAPSNPGAVPASTPTGNVPAGTPVYTNPTRNNDTSKTSPAIPKNSGLIASPQVTTTYIANPIPGGRVLTGVPGSGTPVVRPGRG